jgi:hypothetical protein
MEEPSCSRQRYRAICDRALDAGTTNSCASAPTRDYRLTKPSDLVEADEGASEDHERLVDVGAPFVTDGEAAEAVESGQSALYHPPVPSLWLVSTPRLAMRGWMERARHSLRQRR